MNLSKTLRCVVLIAIFAVLIPVSQVMAGAGPEPPEDAVVLDTKIWGYVTMYCTTAPADLVVVHVKRVVDCNVETQLLVDNQWTADCPAAGDESAPLDWSLPIGTVFFNLPGTPYIVRVKNFKQEINTGAGTNVTSFEAQFGFWVPQ